MHTAYLPVVEVLGDTLALMTRRERGVWSLHSRWNKRSVPTHSLWLKELAHWPIIVSLGPQRKSCGKRCQEPLFCRELRGNGSDTFSRPWKRSLRAVLKR